MDKPHALPPQIEHIPEELKLRRQWIAWNWEANAEPVPGKEWIKVPKHVHLPGNASVSKASTWGDFSEAYATYQQCAYSGIGFVFTDDDPFVGIDLDHHVTPGTRDLDSLACSLLERLPTYAEFSTRGEGLHLIVEGTIPGPKRRNDGLGVEMYEDKRWFIVTGALVPGAVPLIAKGQPTLNLLYSMVFGAKHAAERQAAAAAADLEGEAFPELEDDEVLRLIRASHIAAAFEALWGGSSDANGGGSGGDLALCNYLSFWATDARQVDRLFRASGRLRPKWDELRGGATYGDLTVARAWGQQTDHYQPARAVSVTKRVRAVAAAAAGSVGDGTVQDDVPDAAKTDLWDAAELFAGMYGDTWAYDLGIGCWRRWTGTHFKTEVHRASAPNMSLIRLARRTLRIAGLDITGSGRIDELIRQAAASTGRVFAPQSHLVSFANGTLDLRTHTLRPHAQADGLTACMPFDYRQAPWHRIAAFLHETIDDAEGIEALMMHIGLAIMSDVLVHQMIILLGPPRSGKSTLLQLANATCGQDAKSDAGHQILGGDVEGMRSRAAWNNRRIVTMEELPADSLRAENAVKAMTAHGGAQQRQLYVEERLDNTWRPKLLAATNQRPHYPDHSGALTARLVFIPCPHGRAMGDSRAPLNLTLFAELLPEVEGFAYACLEAAQRCLATGGRYPQSAVMLALLKDIELRGNSMKAFVADCCRFEPTAWTPTTTIYTQYRNYVEDAGNQPMGKEKFAQTLCDAYPEQIGAARRRVDGNGQVRGLKGIKVLSGAALEMETA